jgi:hypothetical protein
LSGFLFLFWFNGKRLKHRINYTEVAEMSIEKSIETRTIEQRGLQAVDVAVVAVLLAVGAVLRMFVPPFAGITPNFIIGMYCLAILLLRPNFAGIIGIGLVSAAVCMVTTKSVIPFLNFISEPIGAVVAGLLALPKLETGILKVVRPFVITYLGTAASGFSYVAVMIYCLTASGKGAPAFVALSSVVLITALANAVLVSVLYFPLKAALGRSR